MKPPICEVCSDFFDPTDGELVRFAGTARGAAFTVRQRTEGIVGHQPDNGWFCGEHVGRARELATEMTLGEALASMRGVRYIPPSPTEPNVPDPLTKDDDLGVGRRMQDIDGSGAIEWPINWLTAEDLRNRCIELAPAIARALGGADGFMLAETLDRRSATVDGQGPDDDPWVDTITLQGEIGTPSGSTVVQVRHVQKHLSNDTIIDVQVDLSVRVTTAAGQRYRATVTAWGHISDDRCNLLRLTAVDTGPVVELIREAFDLGTDRWNQRYDGDGNPICVSCGDPFDQQTGGRAVFRVDAVGHDWNDRLRRGEVSGDRPYQGWFCTRHIGPASLVSNSLARMDAMPLLVPDGRPPLEYREHPEGVEIHADEHGEPGRAPFVPVSLDFEPQWSRDVAITPQTRRDAQLLLARSVWTIGTGLGVDHFRGFGSNGDFSSYQSDEVSAFLMQRISATLTLQRREQTILEIAIRPGEPQQLAPDGAILLERLEIRAVSAEIAAAVQPEMDVLIAQLCEDMVDPFDLAPDLIGVDLCGAELQRGSRGTRGYLNWDIEPMATGRVAERLVELLPSLIELVGGSSVPELEFAMDRSYNPIDHAQPPDCPFTDTSTRRGVTETDTGALSVELDTERVHWNEDVVANASVSLLVRLDELIILASFSGGGAGCTSMSMRRPVVAGSIDVIIKALAVVDD